MKVILLNTIERLGKPFDIVDVRNGYARNYLFPRKLAVEATEGNVRGLEKTKKRFSKQMEKMRTMSMDLMERLSNLTIKTTIKTGIDGKTFGSVTSQDLVSLLKDAGIEINKKNIILEESIKRPGVYDIKVHLGENLSGMFKLILLEEGV